MIEGYVNPHKGNRGTLIMINYSVSSSVTSDARVKVYLNEYDDSINGFDYNIDKTLIDYFTINPDNISPITLKLTDINSGFYRICLRLAYDGDYYRDCDKGNQFLLIDDTPINIIEQPKPLINMIVQSPAKVFAGENFTINITINNQGSSANLKVYSYIINGTYKVSEGFWTANKKELMLSSGTTTNLTLMNTVNSAGDYLLIIKAKGFSEIRKPIKVLIKPVKKLLLNKLRLINNSLRIIVSNAGNKDENVTIKFYSSARNLTKQLILPKGHFFEWFINKSGFDKNVYALLFNNDLLIDEKSLFFNNSKSYEVTNYSSLITESMNELVNDSLLIINRSENVTMYNETMNYLTGHFIATGINMEILLYSLIVTVSLTALYVVLRNL